MLTILLTILHVTVAVFLILVVLLQTGKRADLAGAFGGGGSQTAFGARGAATLLGRLTTWSAAIFMATSLLLALRSSSGSGSGGTVLDTLPASSSQSAPAPTAPSAPTTPPPTAPAPANPAPQSPAPTPGR